MAEPTAADPYPAATGAADPPVDRLAAAEALAGARGAELAALRAELAAMRAEVHRLSPVPADPIPTLPTPAVTEAPAVPLPRMGGLRPRLRAVVLGAYRVVRPITRPLAHRSRTFLTGQLLSEVADLRARHDAVMARLDGLETLIRHPPPPPDQAGFTEAAERLLLTLALEGRPGG